MIDQLIDINNQTELLESVGWDEEELESLLGSLDKLSKNQTLDIFSCVECGRCTEVCPANRGGGVLDPKNHFIMDLKDPLLKNGNAEVVNSINVEAGWECTSCQACSEVCPVGNQVEKAEEIRNLQVLVEGNVPQEYQKLFMNLQTTGNTEGATTSELSQKLPIYDGSQEYVLWLGCFSKYALDPKYGDSVINLTKILDREQLDTFNKRFIDVGIMTKTNLDRNMKIYGRPLTSRILSPQRNDENY